MLLYAFNLTGDRGRHPLVHVTAVGCSIPFVAFTGCLLPPPLAFDGNEASQYQHQLLIHLTE